MIVKNAIYNQALLHCTQSTNKLHMQQNKVRTACRYTLSLI